MSIYVLHIFGILMAIGAYLIVNIIAISEYGPNCSYAPSCFNSNVKPINYVMFWFGVLLLIMLIIFLIIMPCSILNLCYDSKQKSRKESQYVYENSYQTSSSKENDYINENTLKHSSLYSQNNLVSQHHIAHTNNHQTLATLSDEV